MSTESDLRRLRDEAVRIRSKVGQESAEVAKKRSRASDARAYASRSKSASTISMKLREAEGADRDANAAERRRADQEKRLADIEKKIAAAQTKYEKEQQAGQKKALDALRQKTEAATRQFSTLPRMYTSTRSAQPLAPTECDVFLSHASEDKDTIARPLKDALEERGVSVWFDEIQIKVGQSIRLEIERGITQARFGVVVLSPSFFAKQWTQAELDALFSRKVASGEDLILPIWHKVTKDEVLAQSALLAGILALNTSVNTVEEIADRLAEVVRK